MSLISPISSIAIQATNWKIAIEDINSISEGSEKHNLQQHTKEKLSQGRAPGVPTRVQALSVRVEFLRMEW
jgi:hypothetical protein